MTKQAKPTINYMDILSVSRVDNKQLAITGIAEIEGSKNRKRMTITCLVEEITTTTNA